MNDALFFATARNALFGGKLTTPQVQGLDELLKAADAAAWPLPWTAYLLATAFHETNATMQPVREAYWLSEAWRKANLRYYPAYGRGYVQITWAANYAKADAELGLSGKLIANYDLAMQPDIAARIAVRGMSEGWFTGKSCVSYLPVAGAATQDQFTQARRIINGTDAAAKIAAYAMFFQHSLQVAGVTR